MEMNAELCQLQNQIIKSYRLGEFSFSRHKCCGAGARGAVIKLPLGAGAVITNYGPYPDPHCFIEKSHGSINPRKKLCSLVKNLVFEVANKTFSDKKGEILRPQKCSCRSWSRSLNSDIRLARAEKYIYGSATLLAIVSTRC